MQNQWLAMEHYRLHAVEEWPDSPRKKAVLAAIHCKLKSLAGAPLFATTGCAVCHDRMRKLVAFPRSSVVSTPLDAAA